MASKDWQHPYVNIFKHVKVEEWKKSGKQGDVSTYVDKTLKCSVFRIKGSVPANSFILVPKNSNHSLGLTGRYFYLLFKPLSGRFFVVHLDVVAEESRVVRISFSNMFKEFKSTSTWLQFPLLCAAAKDSVHESTSKLAKPGLMESAPTSVRWTCLTLDLQQILSVYSSHCFSHVKSIKLCANMAVKNMFTSDLLLSPELSFSEAKQKGLAYSQGTGPMPREMSFPVPKGSSWHKFYDHVIFSLDEIKSHFSSIEKRSSCSSRASQRSSIVRGSSDPATLSEAIQLISGTPSMDNCPDEGVTSARQSEDWLDNDCLEQMSSTISSHQSTSRPIHFSEDSGVHVFVHTKDNSSKDGENSEEEFVCSSSLQVSESKETKQEKLLPDPILKLHRIIGFGGATTKYALWTKSGDAVVYPCHAIVVSMKISTKEQRFFIGHTDEVSAIALNGNTTLLASAQTGQHSVVRVWNYQKGNCLSMFRIHTHSLCSLSLSHGGSVLCGVGKDRHNKTMVVVWNTQNVTKSGEVTTLAKAHTEVDIRTMRIAFFDDTRMVSCGRDSIRLWRVRNGNLRSCPVNLGEYHSLDFTDVVFEEGNSSSASPEDQTLFASSRSGHIFEIDYSRMVVRNVRRLLLSQQQHLDRREKRTFNTGPGIAINSISVSSSFCATGSEDGFLRLWPLDFSAVFLEAEHEGPVSSVSVSSDSHLVLAATSTGNLGFLDVTSRDYNTLMRSHTDVVLGFSVDGIRRHLTTASADGTVRIWDIDSLHQLYDFVPEDRPCSVAFHPSEQIFSCGSSSGVIRVFNISMATLLAEHTQHRGEIVGLAFSPSGEFMYSADSEGSLTLYDSSEEDHSVIRVACNALARGIKRAPDALTVSSDGRCLAFVGPSEHIVTIADARCLEELLHIDVSILDVESPHLDSALKVCFSPASTEHLLVATSANKILWVSTKTGRLLREITDVHKHQCSSLAVSEDNQFLLTAGDNALKVWDYNMQHHVNSQMFIGHSQPICQVDFTPDQLGVVSVGDAIFFWDFLGQPINSGIENRRSQTLIPISEKTRNFDGIQLSNGMPRKTAPFPSSPPPRLDFSIIDQTDQRSPHLSSFCNDTVINRTVPVQHGGSGSSSASFLKVTELHTKPALCNSHIEHNFQGKSPVRPDCYKHFIPRFKNSTLDLTAVTPLRGEEGIRLKAVIGYNGNGRGNMVWSPDQGLFAYSCGCMVVVEFLDSGCQRHLQGHSEEISCLAISNDAKTLASAAASINGTQSVIFIWDVQNGTRCKEIFHHKGMVQSLAFSRDDRFFLSVGDFSDPKVSLWSNSTFQLLSSVCVSGPIHDASFSPSSASQLACVGSQGLYFCHIHTHGPDIHFKGQKVKAPEEVGDVELTSLCYHMDSILFTATNQGHVCAWDVNTQQCFMTWEADEGEIGVLLCRGNYLLTGSNSRWLRLWEMEAVHKVEPGVKDSNVRGRVNTVTLEQEVMLDGTIVSAAFDAAMDMGIVGTTTGTLWYISWSDSRSIRLVSGHKTKVNDVIFSDDETQFATCSEDGSVRVWSLLSNELVVQFQVLNQACGCVCWSRASDNDSACVAAGYSDGTLRTFNLSSAEMEMKLQPHQVAITAIQYSANGHVILSGAKNGLVAVSSAVTGMTIRVIKDHKGAQITAIQSVSTERQSTGLRGSEMLLATSADRRVSVWSVDWLKEKCNLLDWLTFPAPIYNGDDAPPPSLAAFCPADPSLLVYTGYGVEKELSFYSLTQKQIIKKIALPHWATCLSLAPKGQLMAVGSKERLVKVIKWSSGRFQDFVQHSDSVQTCQFSPSGALLFTVAHNEILLWDVHGL